MIKPSPSNDFLVVRGNDPLPEGLLRPVLAIGNFDGVHRGHRAVIDEAKALARVLDAPAAALTFEPHPRAYFQKDIKLFRLTPEAEKLAALAAAGLQGAVVLTFDQDLATLSADEFVDRILVQRLGVSGVVVGFDFHFGKGRAGSPKFLDEQGLKRGFQVRVVAPMREEGDAISSTSIRSALASGQMGHAAYMLGRPFSVRAQVIHGDKRGRELGYPTANLALSADIPLAFGVYAVRAHTPLGTFDGVASYGTRPTFDDGRPLLEVHLFDMKGDLYGAFLDVELHAFLRPELKFGSIADLIAQMDADSASARQLLAGIPGK